MKLGELEPAAGSRSKHLRKDCGLSLGHGFTSGRGTKEQKAYGKTRLGFEGDQMLLHRQIPKRGLTNINREKCAIINLASLNKFDDGTEAILQLLIESGLVKDLKNDAKILGSGKLEKKLTIRANKSSASAAFAIEAVGGKTEVMQPVRSRRKYIQDRRYP